MGMAQLVVTAVLVEGRDKSEVARDYGLSRRWVITLVQRYLAEGEAGLAPRSRRPHASPTRPAAAVFTAPAINRLYVATAATHGDPAGVLTDNGAVFTGRHRGGGRVALEVTLHARGVLLSHSRPYHPQTCGKVERFHQTEKKWLAHQPPATTIAELQAQLDTFRDYYNTRRPHRALHRHTPAEAYAARPKAAASGNPLIDGHFRVRHDTIDSNGKLTLRHNSRLHHIGIGRRHAGTPS